MMRVQLLYKYRPCKPQPIDEEPCELYDSCADIMSPKQAMLKMLATGQQVDLNRRQAFYDSEEMEEYIEAEYPCDYITAYKEYMDNMQRAKVKSGAKVEPGVNKTESTASSEPVSKTTEHSDSR